MGKLMDTIQNFDGFVSRKLTLSVSITVNFGRGEWTYCSLLYAKYRLYRCNVSGRI